MAELLFDDPVFVSFLEFWEKSRGDAPLPRWGSDTLAGVPAPLVPKLVVGEGFSDPVYLHTGTELVRHWGSDRSGRRIVGETLTGKYAAYILSLWQDTLTRGGPIFSAAIFGGGDSEVILSGRLFAPFVARGETTPTVIMSVHLFRGADIKLSKIDPASMICETKRYFIAGAPTLCRRLAEASRWHRLARRVPDPEIGRQMATVARDLTGTALRLLPRFEERP